MLFFIQPKSVLHHRKRARFFERLMWMQSELNVGKHGEHYRSWVNARSFLLCVFCFVFWWTYSCKFSRHRRVLPWVIMRRLEDIITPRCSSGKNKQGSWPHLTPRCWICTLRALLNIWLFFLNKNMFYRRSVPSSSSVLSLVWVCVAVSRRNAGGKMTMSLRGTQNVTSCDAWGGPLITVKEIRTLLLVGYHLQSCFPGVTACVDARKMMWWWW